MCVVLHPIRPSDVAAFSDSTPAVMSLETPPGYTTVECCKLLALMSENGRFKWLKFYGLKRGRCVERGRTCMNLSGIRELIFDRIFVQCCS